MKQTLLPQIEGEERHCPHHEGRQFSIRFDNFLGILTNRLHATASPSKPFLEPRCSKDEQAPPSKYERLRSVGALSTANLEASELPSLA